MLFTVVAADPDAKFISAWAKVRLAYLSRAGKN